MVVVVITVVRVVNVVVIGSGSETGVIVVVRQW